MRSSIPLYALALAGGAAASPTPGLISDLLGNLATMITSDLNVLLKALGVVLQNDASKHGAALPYHDQCPFTVDPVDVSDVRHSHTIGWPKGVNGGNFIDWKTYKANGANLGSWLEKEKTHDPIWWSSVGGDSVMDEWSLCQLLGSKCGPVLEARYASFLNTTTIDQLASVGVNTLRIPTTYKPGSIFQDLSCTMASNRLTSRPSPSGVNSLDIGEAFRHGDWFQNTTNLAYSFQAIDGILSFIKASGHTNVFTIAPINEASDTHLAGFGTDAGLTDAGVNWINTYHQGVLKKIAKVDSRIPMMIQDCFKGAGFWAPFYNSSNNIVFDSHVYYFAAAGTYSQYVNPAVCGQAAYIKNGTTFPVFVGEWSLQTMYNNTFAGRKTIFDTQRYAWQNYVAGGSFWTAVSYATDKVDGEGTVRDYWSFIDLINAGVITTQTNSSYC
ncbi:hypothetical protein LTR15_006591 [Elasticomyces elasticus]|nr:hypothetical protein LTR15_006591 [Elasticomyces elasticus]